VKIFQVVACLFKMTNKILALKYRPQEFKDLIGQEIMSKTITNAIKLGKTPNAYLLTVTRMTTLKPSVRVKNFVLLAKKL
jgi:hypothetical protein